MRNLIFLFTMCALFVIGTQQSVPIWDIVTNCTIPNESEMGKCEYPADCPAFQDINDVSSIGNISRLSFVSQLQCSGLADGKICCPRRGPYVNPWISMTNITKKVRSKPISVSKRVGIRVEVPCGEPDFEMQVNNGEIAKIDDFPWMAMLIYEKAMNPVTPGCGGALISRTFVVTAAHCLKERIVRELGKLKFVRVGEYDLHNDPDCVVDGQYADCTEGKIDVIPKRTIVHPEYKEDSISQHHDIGLVELGQPIEYSTFVRHICLPDMGSGKIAKAFSVCGWGRTDFFSRGKGTNIPSPIKLKTSLPHFDHRKCSEIYQQQRLELINGQICAGGRNARDTCSGDSGSPLMFFDTKKAAWILSGLVSMGPRHCGTVGKPGIYTNINEYVPWIKSNANL